MERTFKLHIERPSLRRNCTQDLLVVGPQCEPIHHHAATVEFHMSSQFGLVDFGQESGLAIIPTLIKRNLTPSVFLQTAAVCTILASLVLVLQFHRDIPCLHHSELKCHAILFELPCWHVYYTVMV